MWLPLLLLRGQLIYRLAKKNDLPSLYTVRFSLSLVLCNFIMTCPGVNGFLFILFRIIWAPWIYGLVSLTSSRKFPATKRLDMPHVFTRILLKFWLNVCLIFSLYPLYIFIFNLLAFLCCILHNFFYFVIISSTLSALLTFFFV